MICRSCLDMIDVMIDLIEISKKSDLKIKDYKSLQPDKCTDIKEEIEESERLDDFLSENGDHTVSSKVQEINAKTVKPIPTKSTKNPKKNVTVNKNLTELTKVPQSQSSGFQCTSCGRIMKNLSGLKQHELSHQNVQRYSCDYCPVKCKTKGCLLVNIHYVF